jgi:hypothetical protein
VVVEAVTFPSPPQPDMKPTPQRGSAPVSTKFVKFTSARPNQDGGHPPILINPAHVRTAHQSGSDQVTLVMDHGRDGVPAENVMGDLETVWQLLTGEK